MNAFFVTGLPRSRTAWFSNLLTWGKSFCFHDGFYGLDTLDEFRKRMETTAPIVGNSDPANIFVWEQIDAWFPKAKWVVVNRRFDDVVQSCRLAFPEAPVMALSSMQSRLRDLASKLNPMIVNFDAIDADAAMSVADYLGVNVGPRRRVEQLCRMNVQLDRDYLREAVRNVLDNPPSWMSKE